MSKQENIIADFLNKVADSKLEIGALNKNQKRTTPHLRRNLSVVIDEDIYYLEEITIGGCKFKYSIKVGEVEIFEFEQADKITKAFDAVYSKYQKSLEDSKKKAESAALNKIKKFISGK